jgi:hypothetical protein
MSIQGRSLVQQEWERALRRSNPFKIKLIRARAYNCVGGKCFENGRESISATCPVCAGTGYLGVSFNGSGIRIITSTGAFYNDALPPASDIFFIYGDVQTGHGLYGAGGDYLKLLMDLGKQDVGDATLFSLMYDRDRRTGDVIFPLVAPTLPRPDRVVTRYGNEYNVVKQLIAEIGATQICRIFTLEQGTFTATITGGSR